MLTKHKKTSGQGNRTKVITRRRPPKIVASENLSTRLQEGIMAMSSILLLIKGKKLAKKAYAEIERQCSTSAFTLRVPAKDNHE